ncbi:MAG: YbaB/EbfC family nucleoid-associated protein [Flavobacteriales bacterium]|tara:strand:- start:2688 stop:3020 length:333 start_codon:yes stop_codon:yes gene_type:complete
MFGVGAIKEKLEEAKRKAEETKVRLDSVYVEGSSGGYAKVVSSANSRIMQIILKDEAKEFSHAELCRHIQIATNEALDKARGIYELEMSVVAKEALPNIPGLGGLGGMFK